MDERLERCRACGRDLEMPFAARDGIASGIGVGLIEDEAALCGSCAHDAARDYDLPPLDAA